MQNVCAVCILSRAQWNPYALPLDVCMGERQLLGPCGPFLVSARLQLLLSPSRESMQTGFVIPLIDYILINFTVELARAVIC